MGDHKREKTIEERWSWEIIKREQSDKVAPKNRVVGVVSLTTDQPHTLSEDAYGNRYWLAPDRDGKRGGLRKLTSEEATKIEALVRAKQELSARATEVVLRPTDVPLLERTKVGVQRLWRKLRQGR